MKNSCKIIFFTVIASLFLYSNINAKELRKNILETDITHKLRSLVKRSSDMAIVNNELVYLEKKDRKLIFVRDKDNAEIIIAPIINSSHFWIKGAGKYVHIFWWEKFSSTKESKKLKGIKGKILYARSSRDGGKSFGSRRIITKGQGVLPNVSIVADEEGHVSIAYLDERYKGYQIFTNSSLDGGQSWKEDDYRLDHSDKSLASSEVYSANSPNIAQVKDELIIVWHQIDIENGKKLIRLYSRVSKDFGKTWEEQKKIYESTKYRAVSINIYAQDNQAYLAISIPRGEVLLLTKQYEAEWKQVSGYAPNSDSYKGSNYFRMVADEKYFYLSYTSVEKIIAKKVIWHVELVRLNREKNEWVPGSKQFDFRGMGIASKGSYQDLAILNDGTVIITWEDYRGILPFIAFNYSTDQGESWLKEPLSVSQQDALNTSRYPFIKVINNKAFLVFQTFNYPEGKKPIVESMVTLVNSPKSNIFKKELYALKKMPNSLELRARLKERFKRLKQDRITKKWRDAWELLDPVYKNLYKKGMWLDTRNRMIFKEMNLTKIDLQMPYAFIHGTMTYDLNTDYIDAEPNDPRFTNQKVAFVLKWGWFNDDWYFISESTKEQYLP